MRQTTYANLQLESGISAKRQNVTAGKGKQFLYSKSTILLYSVLTLGIGRVNWWGMWETRQSIIWILQLMLQAQPPIQPQMRG